jgi:hypothetical protein
MHAEHTKVLRHRHKRPGSLCVRWEGVVYFLAVAGVEDGGGRRRLKGGRTGPDLNQGHFETSRGHAANNWIATINRDPIQGVVCKITGR